MVGFSLVDRSNMSTEDKIKRARIRMFKKSPFFSYILLYLNMKEDNSVPTMGVDAKGNVYYNKEWVDTLSEDELMGLISHEVAHYALRHMSRLGTRDAHIFNICNDLVVNELLVNDGFTLPAGGCIPHNHSFDIPIKGGKKHTIKNINEKSSEEIYDEIYGLLEDSPDTGINPRRDKSGRGGGNPVDGDDSLNGFDEHRYGKTDVGEERKAKETISEAANVAKMQGKLPAGLERMVDNLLDTKVSWKHKLYKYVVDQIITDFAWDRPSKRGAALGIYLPRPVRESIKIVASIDTSGSISRDELSEFLGELIGIGNSFENITMEILVCDAEIHETYTLTKDNVDDILSMKMSGGGGTSHIPVYDYVETNIQDCRVLINFTDGFTSYPDKEYPFDSLWVLTSKNSCAESNVPFGEVIKVE